MTVEVQSVVEKHWKSNSGKQETYLSLPDSIFEQFYGGAAGGGKTEALLMRPILRQWTDVPRFQGILLRRTYKELEESVIERSKRGGVNKDGTEIPSFYDFGAEYNEQKKRWRWPSGATMTFGHAEEESDIRKYDTSEYQYCAFDELTSFTEFQYKFMAFSRVRSIIPNVPALVCSGSNPGNIGHRWVRERFVEPARQGGKILAESITVEGIWWCQSNNCSFSTIKLIPSCPLCDGEIGKSKKIKRIFIQAFLADNPRLMDNDPMYRVRLEMLPEADKRAKAYGDWWTFSGQVFAEWRTEPFVDEPSNACHVVSPIIPDARLPRVLAIDWGKRALTFGIWGVPLPKGRTLIYREYPPMDKDGNLIRGEEVSVWTTNMANICMLEGINPYIVLDPSAWQSRGVKTVADQFIETWKEVTGKNPRIEKADNDRIGGKMLVHDYLRWKARPKLVINFEKDYNVEHAAWLLRNKGIESHRFYLSQFAVQKDTIEETIPKLLITSDCKTLIKTIPLCVYDEQKDANEEDVKEFVGDDPYDDLRYYLKKIATMKVDEMIGEVNNTQEFKTEKEWNTYYRKMEYLEAQKKKKKSLCIPLGRLSRRRF